MINYETQSLYVKETCNKIITHKLITSDSNKAENAIWHNILSKFVKKYFI